MNCHTVFKSFKNILHLWMLLDYEFIFFLTDCIAFLGGKNGVYFVQKFFFQGSVERHFCF